MPRFFKRILVGTGCVFAILLIGAATFFWRLRKAPIDVSDYIPSIVSLLAPADSGITLTLSSAFLQWGGFAYPLELSVKDVDARYKDGKTMLSVPEASVTFSLRSLIVGHLIPRSLTIKHPYVRLKVNEQGDLYVSDTVAEVKDDSEKTSAFSPEFVSQLMVFQNDISRFLLRDAHIIIDDAYHKTKWNISPLNLTYRQSFLNHRVSGNVTVDTAGAPLKVKLGGEWKTPSNVRLRLRVDELNPESIRLAEKHPFLKNFKVPVGLEGVFSLNMRPFLKHEKTWRRETVEQVELTLRIGKGNVILPDPVLAEYDVEKATVTARWYDEGDKFDITSFNVALTTGAKAVGHIEVSGLARAIDGRIWTPVHAVMTADAVNVPLDRLKVYWPGIVAPDEHDWVTTNITVGRAAKSHFVLKFDGVKEGGIDCSFVDGTVDVVNARVLYLDEMPSVNGVNGHLVFSRNDIKGTLSAGEMFGVTLQKGTLDFLELQSDIPKMVLNLNLQGPVRGVLQVLNTPYLSFLKGTGITPEKADGRITGDFYLKMPLGETLKGPDQLDIKTTAVVTDGALTNVYAGLDFSDISVDLSIADRLMYLDGSGLLFTSPVTFALTQSFKKDARLLTELRAKGTLNNLSRGKLDGGSGILTPPSLDGLMKTDVTFFYFDDAKAQLDVAMNLTNMEIDVKQIGWRKRAPVPASGEFRLEMADGIPQSGATFSLSDEANNSVSGTVDFLSDGDLSAVTAQVSTERTKANVATHFYSEQMTVDVTGAELDLSGMIKRANDKEVIASAAETDDAKLAKLSRKINVKGKIDKIWLGNDGTATGTEFSAFFNGQNWNSIHVDSKIGKDIPVNFTVSPDGPEKYEFVLTSPDAGETLRVLDIIDTVKDGNVVIKGVYFPIEKKTSGTLSVSKFYVGEMPIFTRILSLSGIIDTVKGEGLQFDKSEIPFTFDDNTLTVSSGVISGPSIGVTVNGQYFKETGYVNLRGSVVPFYTLNSLLGKIPLIGSIFSGDKGGGLIAPTYTVQGKLPDPEISVSALSALAPGAVSRFVSMLTEKEGDLSRQPEPVSSPSPTVSKKSSRREVLSSSSLVKTGNKKQQGTELNDDVIRHVKAK